MNGDRREWHFHISPRHGLAAPLSPCKAHTFRGKAFCFLPLPINTNHVNGQFVLSKSWKSLWISNEQDKSKIWNDNLIEAISSSYAHFLVIARQYYVQTTVRRSQDLATALSRYYQLFPYLEEPFEFSPQLLTLGTGIGHIVLKPKSHQEVILKMSGNHYVSKPLRNCGLTMLKYWLSVNVIRMVLLVAWSNGMCYIIVKTPTTKHTLHKVHLMTQWNNCLWSLAW